MKGVQNSKFKRKKGQVLMELQTVNSNVEMWVTLKKNLAHLSFGTWVSVGIFTKSKITSFVRRDFWGQQLLISNSHHAPREM